MAGSKISALTALTAPAPDDLLAVVDVSDTSMAATGTDKKITFDTAVNRIPERTLSATGGTIGVADCGTRIICTATGTHTIAAAATLLGGFSCEVVNDSGGTVTLDGPGATNVAMAADEVAVILCCNSKIRVSKGASTVTS